MYPKVAKVELKQPIVQAIAEDIKDAQSVVLVDYRGLTVEQDTALRKQFREAGVSYKVCKNTMMKRAFEGTEFAGLQEFLEGPSAIAISKEDATAPARILCEFAKNAEALELNPNFGAASHERGRAQLLNGDKDGSIEDMKKSLELNPKEGENLNGQFNNQQAETTPNVLGL